MSLSNRTTSRGGKGAKGDKAHKVDKNAEASGSGGGGVKSAADKQQASAGGGGDNQATQANIKQLIELTQRSEEQVCLALYDCDFDLDKACNMLFEIKNEDTWETTVKKKKNRQQSTSKSEQKAEGGAPGGAGEEWNESQPHGGGGGGDKDKPRNKTGGPQRLHGRHNDSRGWRGREKQENERNLEDGGQSRERRGRSGGPTRGGGGGRGRGGGRAGGRYPQRSNRGASGGGTFNNRPMETWDNTWENTTATNHTNTEENWDEFPGADEWCGTLAETKVFTPSQPPEPIMEPEPKQGATPLENSTLSSVQSMDMLAQMQNSPVAMGGALNAAQTQYFSQLTQQNSGTDMKYNQQAQTAGYGGQQYQQTSNTYGNTAYNSGYVTEQVPVQQAPVRTKTQRARVPPPSKIPSSAVEMPGDLNSSIGYLDLQFGAMDMMSDSSSFDGVDPKYGNASLSEATGAPTMDLNSQSQSSTAPNLDAYSPQKATAQNSISSALSQSLSNTDSIPQTSEHGGYSSSTVSTQQRSSATSAASATQQNSTLDLGGAKQTDAHSYSSQQTNYYPKSTYQNQTYSSTSSSYSGTQTTSSYVANQSGNSYVVSDATAYNAQSGNSSTYQNAYTATNSYQSNANAGSGSTGAGFPSISQANNTYPSNNQAYQQNASQSVYGNPAVLNNSTNYSSNSSGQYNSYNSNHSKLGKDGATGGYENSTTAASSVSSTSTSTTTGLALTQTTASVTKANTTLVKNSSSVVSNIPPNAPVMSTQYIMGQVPYFQPPPIYSYEEVQMLQQRIPHMTTPFYEMSYQTPTTTLRDGNYSLTDGRFTRTDSNASPVPSTQTTTQPMLAAQTTGPYFFAPYNPMQPSYQFGAVYTSQLPAGTNAHGSSNNAQYPKPGTYGSNYTSGYDTLSQSQDYNKGGYVGNTQGQNKGAGANASSAGNAANDLSAIYGKSHTALGKVNSYEKQGFHSGTPPPFTGALGQSALAPSGTGYGPQMYIPTMPHQQHSTQLMHQPLHQMEVRHQGRRMDSGNSTGQRTQANNQQKSGAKQGYPTNSYWNQS